MFIVAGEQRRSLPRVTIGPLGRSCDVLTKVTATAGLHIRGCAKPGQGKVAAGISADRTATEGLGVRT